MLQDITGHLQPPWDANVLGGKSKPVLSLPPSLLLFGLYGPPGKHLQTSSCLQPCDRRQIRTAKDCHPSWFFIRQAFEIFEIYTAIGAPARPRGMRRVTMSPCRKTSLLFAPGNLEGTGLLQHHSNTAKANSQILGRKQPKEPQELKARVTNSSYHLPLGAITAANDFAFCWQDESLREAKQKEKYFTK